VAEVIFHRMNTGNYGHSICAVVYEGVGTATCQFSFHPRRLARRQKVARAVASSRGAAAARILTGEEHLNDATGGAVNFPCRLDRAGLEGTNLSAPYRSAITSSIAGRGTWSERSGRRH
jgi:hypothetical protein